MPYIVLTHATFDTKSDADFIYDQAKQVAVDSTASPQPPTNIQFRITCGDSCEIEEIVQEQ